MPFEIGGARGAVPLPKIDVDLPPRDGGDVG